MEIRRARIEAPRDLDIDEAREIVDATHIEVQVTSARMQVRTDLSDVRQWWKHGRRRAMPRAHYEIRVPRETDLDLALDRVDVTVRGVEGTIALQLNPTDLEATDLTGRVSIHSDRGDIEAVRLHGALQLYVERGNAAMRDVRIAGNARVAIGRGDLDLELVNQHRALRRVLISGFARASSPTHPRIFTAPSSLAEAMVDATGNLVADAWHAAMAIEHGCEWTTTDGDFARFPGLRSRHPLKS